MSTTAAQEVETPKAPAGVWSHDRGAAANKQTQSFPALRVKKDVLTAY